MLENILNVFKTKFTKSGWVFVFLLSFSLLGFLEKALYDFSHFIDKSYNDSFVVLFIHILVMVLLLIGAVSFMHICLKKKKEDFAVFLLPYFLVCIIYSLQVSFEIISFVFTNLPKIALYLCLFLVILFFMFNLYYVEKFRLPRIIVRVKDFFKKSFLQNRIKDIIHKDVFENKNFLGKYTDLLLNIYSVIAFLVVGFFLYVVIKFW